MHHTNVLPHLALMHSKIYYHSAIMVMGPKSSLVIGKLKFLLHEQPSDPTDHRQMATEFIYFVYCVPVPKMIHKCNNTNPQKKVSLIQKHKSPADFCIILSILHFQHNSQKLLPFKPVYKHSPRSPLVSLSRMCDENLTLDRREGGQDMSSMVNHHERVYRVQPFLKD